MSEENLEFLPLLSDFDTKYVSAVYDSRCIECDDEMKPDMFGSIIVPLCNKCAGIDEK